MLQRSYVAAILYIISCCLSATDGYSQTSISSSTIIAGIGSSATVTYGVPTRLRNGPCRPGTNVCSSTGTGVQITIPGGSFPTQPTVPTTATDGSTETATVLFITPQMTSNSPDSFGDLYIYAKLSTVRPTTDENVIYDWMHNAMRNGFFPTSDYYWTVVPAVCSTLGPSGTTGITGQSDGDFTSSGLKVRWSARNTVRIVDNDTTQLMITYYGVIPGYVLSFPCYSYSSGGNTLIDFSIGDCGFIGQTLSTNRVYFRYDYTANNVLLYMDTLDMIYENSDSTQPSPRSSLRTGIRQVLSTGQWVLQNAIELTGYDIYFPNTGINPGTYTVSQIPNTRWICITFTGVSPQPRNQGYMKPQNKMKGKAPPKKKG
jgi:hypothetical protein